MASAAPCAVPRRSSANPIPGAAGAAAVGLADGLRDGLRFAAGFTTMLAVAGLSAAGGGRDRRGGRVRFPRLRASSRYYLVRATGAQALAADWGGADADRGRTDRGGRRVSSPTATPVVAFIGSIIVFFGFNIWVPATYAWSIESFPTRARTTGFGIVDGIGHVGGGVGVLLIAPLLAKISPLERVPADRRVPGGLGGDRAVWRRDARQTAGSGFAVVWGVLTPPAPSPRGERGCRDALISVRGL